MTDTNFISEAIRDYIDNQWYSGIDWEIEMTNSDDNYIAILRNTQSGYDIEDYTFSVTISFDRVQDDSDEWSEELANEDEGTVCLSAFVDVEDITFPEVHPIWSEDIHQYSETISDVSKFIYRVYSAIPARRNERLYFFYTK